MTFKDYYNSEVKSALVKELDLKNLHEAPILQKVVVNVGVGEAATNKKLLDEVAQEISLITGQKAIITKARQSVAAFKIRKGMPIGVKVTLRGQKMYDFLEKLVKIVLPRFRDFSGIDKTSVDTHGNLNLGIGEQTLFPEIEYDKITKLHGLQITVVTSALVREVGMKLFTKLGIPFKN